VSFKSVIISIWNGPFHIGELSRPVSVGEAILKIFESIWRLLVSLIVLISTAAASVALYYRFFQEKPIKTQIMGRVLYDIKACSKEYPLAAIFKNNSNHTVTKIHFKIEINAIGRSSNLNSKNNEYLSDMILPPGAEGGICVSSPALDRPINDAVVFYTPIISYAEFDDSIVMITPSAPPAPPKPRL
jgi:hypothetical protein